MNVIPAVDVLDGKVVRLRQGRYEDVTVYAEDPVAMVGSWVEQGATIVHVVDLAGARDGNGDQKLWRRLGASGLPFQLGGGIRSRGDVEGLLAAGAARAVLGTTAVWDAEALRGILDAVGAEAVVAAIDVREGRATGAGWRDRGRELDQALVAAHARSTSAACPPPGSGKRRTRRYADQPNPGPVRRKSSDHRYANAG